MRDLLRKARYLLIPLGTLASLLLAGAANWPRR